MSCLHKENNNCFNPPRFLFIIIYTAKTSNMIAFLKVLNISNVQVHTINM